MKRQLFNKDKEENQDIWEKGIVYERENSGLLSLYNYSEQNGQGIA